MQKNSLKETVLQWFVPIFLLLGLIIVILIDFTIVTKEAITELHETNNKQVGKSYAENIESELDTIASISDIMQNMVETRGGTNIVYLMDTVDAVVNSCDAYMAAYCWENGDAVLPNRVSGNLADTSYFELLQGKDNFFAFTEDDGVTGQPAYLYVCPVEWLGAVNGYLITYIEPALLENVFVDAHYGGRAYYAMVNQGGDVLATYGNVDSSEILKSDFWNALKPVAESVGHWSVFQRQRENGDVGVLKVITEKEQRTLYSFAVGGTEWNLVVCLDDKYVTSSLDSIWGPVEKLVLRVSIPISIISWINI